MTPLGLSLIAIAIGGYYALVHPRTSGYPLLRRAVLLLALVLVPASGYRAWQQIRGERLLEALVQPYPEAVEALGAADGAARVPQLRGTWILETPDRPPAVLSFYRDPENLRGWEIARETDETLILRRDAQTLYIWASIQRPGVTMIVYQVSPAD